MKSESSSNVDSIAVMDWFDSVVALVWEMKRGNAEEVVVSACFKVDHRRTVLLFIQSFSHECPNTSICSNLSSGKV